MKAKILIGLMFVLAACSPKPEYIVVTATSEAITPTVPTPIIVTATPESITPTPIVITTTPQAAFPTASPVPYVLLVRAIQDIQLGSMIEADRVDMIPFPAEYAPNTAFVAVEDVIGKYAISAIYNEQIILERQVSDNPELVDFGTMIVVVIAARDLEQDHVLEEDDLAIAFYVRNAVDLFEANGANLDGRFMTRSTVIDRSLSRAVSQFEPITSDTLSGG